jgi:hypothetical protein
MHFPEGTEWVVFTNDREYAESKDFIPEDAVYVEEDEISTLALMSRCKGGICANSTFSWWGARLNPDRRIIIPDLWFTDPNFRSDGYYYPGWGIIGVYPVALSAGLP